MLSTISEMISYFRTRWAGRILLYVYRLSTFFFSPDPTYIPMRGYDVYCNDDVGDMGCL